MGSLRAEIDIYIRNLPHFVINKRIRVLKQISKGQVECLCFVFLLLGYQQRRVSKQQHGEGDAGLHEKFLELKPIGQLSSPTYITQVWQQEFLVKGSGNHIRGKALGMQPDFLPELFRGEPQVRFQDPINPLFLYNSLPETLC